MTPNDPGVRQQIARAVAAYRARTGVRAVTAVVGGRVWRLPRGRRLWQAVPQPRPWIRHDGRYPGRRRSRSGR